MSPEHCDTSLLNIAYRSGGPDGGTPVLLLHGWPDDPTTFDHVAPALHRAGYRTFAPWLRGFGATRFHSRESMRSAQMVALAQDAIEFADVLGLARFAVVGHDWGARISYILSALYPNRVTHNIAMSVGWAPGELATPPLAQARAYWYQWFMSTDRGAEVVRRDGVAFARCQWETWSRPGWFDDATFDHVARSFANPDWAEITLHAYRVRWGEAEPDPAYTAVEARYNSIRSISAPTLMIQGGDDRCVLASSSAGKEQFFTNRYQRHVLEGVGHFPTREAPEAVSRLLVDFLR